jgi:ABC-type transport system involved in cytochrome bd biosynthesis fused ATPase/permease subunit
LALRLAWRAGRRELTLMLALQVVQVAGLVVQDVLDDALAEQHQQRLALARLFFRDAPFVILDEPTAALDAKAEHALFASIRELLADRSVLLISHRSRS